MTKRIGHIGIIVGDIDKSVAAFAKALDLPVPAVKDATDKQMKVAVMNVGDVGIEFIQDYGENGPYRQTVAERGDLLHHFCVLADDVQTEINAMQARGVDMADLEPRMGLRGKPIAFAQATELNGVVLEISSP